MNVKDSVEELCLTAGGFQEEWVQFVSRDVVYNVCLEIGAPRY